MPSIARASWHVALLRMTARDNAWRLGWSRESLVIVNVAACTLMILTGGLEDSDRLTSLNFFWAMTRMESLEYGHNFGFSLFMPAWPAKILQADE
jgi:hypothetical protein